MNGVIRATEKAEVVYEVRDYTGDIAVERKDCKKASLTILFLQNQSAFSHGEIELFRLEVLALGSYHTLSSLCVFQYIYKAFIL